ncbi:hypothetical protein Tco_0369704 [Tanacetum coccineum]
MKKKDFLNKPLYSRFSKTDNFKGVPHPLTGDYTPKPQEEIDDSLYVYGKKGPQKPKFSDSDDNSTEHSTCQSNDSKGSFGNPSEHCSESESESISIPNEMSASNLSHLIKDCDYYEKKMAREAEFKKQRVFNTGNRVAKPVWTNANRVNHANQFVSRSVQLNAGRPNINFVRPNINIGRLNVNSVRPYINSVRQNVNSVKTNINIVRSKQPVPTNNINSFSPGTAVKTSAGYNWRRPRPNSNYNSGSNFVRTDHPLKNMEDRGIFDSGCSGHMTGNKDHLDDFEECKGGSVTFGGSKGYITGKGRIRVVRAKLEANRDLSSKVLSIDFFSDDFAKKMVELISGSSGVQEHREGEIEEKRPYLKKLKSDELKEVFDKCVEKVEKFIPMNSELEASKLKRTCIDLQAEVFKKQKIIDVPDVTKDESRTQVDSARSDIEEDVMKLTWRKSG